MKFFGLNPLPFDPRDLTTAVFGTVRNLPTVDFMVCAPLDIKDQKDTDYCGAYSSTASSEDQEGVMLSPEYQFMLAKTIEGKPDEFGCDLRSVMKSFTKIGSIEAQYAPFNVDTPREVIINPESWPPMLTKLAAEHKKSSYFSVQTIGYQDLFDAMRGAMWQNRQYKRSITTGALWRPEWSEAKDGIIPMTYGEEGSGHAFKICGQKTINGVLHLVAQLSNGKGFGDNGLFYFPREVINKEFNYGSYLLHDMDVETARYLVENNLTYGQSWITQLFKLFTGFFRQRST